MTESTFSGSCWFIYLGVQEAIVQRSCGIVLHTNIQLGKELVSSLLTKNVSNHRQGILVVLNYFIKLAQVADPANSAVFLWCDKRR